MGFLSPLFLVTASAIAVPVVLHLFHRRRTKRVPFPALRYLRRTEREQAQRIRLRQLVLLGVRCAALLLLSAAGARVFVRGPSDAHDPTALAIVLDNSLSSGRVVGERRALDELLDIARVTLDRASSSDRIWVIRAGEPWDVAPPTGPVGARARVTETQPSAAAADLAEALARAKGLVETAELSAAEIHLLSDLQFSGFAAVEPGDVGEIPVIVWSPEEDETINHFLGETRIGGGLPPLAGHGTEVAVPLGSRGDTSLMTVRLVVGDEVRAVASGHPGESVVLPVGPFPEAEVTGWVETDPDALGADDRRYLAFDVRPPVRITRTGPPSFFLDEGLGVLLGAGRARSTGADSAEIVLATEGVGADGRAGRVLVVVPPRDPNILPALNRRLSVAGIPWSYELSTTPGEVSLGESRLPIGLADLRIRRHYELTPLPGTEPTADIPARLATGEPLIVADRDAEGSYLLLAVPLDTAWSTLPVDAGMVPVLQWLVGQSGASPSGNRTVGAGEPIDVDVAVTHVTTPDGARHAVDPTRSFRETKSSGLYTLLRNDSVVEHVAVNPPISESESARATPEQLAQFLGPHLVRAGSPGAWARSIFTQRQGPELWRPLLIAALLLLVAEGWIAAPVAAGPQRARAPAPHPEQAEERASAIS
jgi:hypothetical protein